MAILTICERCGNKCETHWTVPLRRENQGVIQAVTYALVCESCYNAVHELARQSRTIDFGFLQELTGENPLE